MKKPSLRFAAAIAAALFIAFTPSAALTQSVGGPVAAGQAMAQVDPGGRVAIVAVPPVPDASVSVGTLGGQLLGWIAAVFGTPIAMFLVAWVRAIAKKAGVEVSAAMGEKLDGIIENGIHAAAAKAQADLSGKMTVEIKNQVLAGAVAYAQTHGADTIKDLANNNSSLGWLKQFDPNSDEVKQALAARAARALNEIAPPASAPAAAAAAVPQQPTAVVPPSAPASPVPRAGTGGGQPSAEVIVEPRAPAA
jgi:hypothetical protein